MAQMQYPEPDPLYLSYGKDLYRITGDEQSDQVMNTMQATQPGNAAAGIPSAGTLVIPADAIDSGQTASTTVQASGAQLAGKKTFTDTEVGYFLGIDNGIGVFNIGDGVNYIKWDGTTLTVTGSASVGSLNIPDTTTANSFHVDTSGNTWWGSNVATGISGANAAITSAGLATFKNILIGGATIQYQVTNAGIFSFGDGSDGAATFDGIGAVAGASLAGSIYTLTRDVYYTDATISTGVTVKPSGYRIFGTGTLTENGTAVIQRNGNNGTAGGTGASGGAGGAALSDGYLKGSAKGGNGGNGGVPATSPVNGQNGTDTANSLGSSGANAGNGGAGLNPGGVAATGGSGGSATAANVALIANWHLATLLDVSSTGSTVKFDNSASPAGGGGGGKGSGTGVGGAGGGGGSPGGILAIYFRNIVIGASASITANGGNGGDGGVGGTDTGGGGGGGGANGGQVILVYNALTNSGSITAAAGTKGTGGAIGTGTSAAGSDGSAGSPGTVRQFQISM